MVKGFLLSIFGLVESRTGGGEQSFILLDWFVFVRKFFLFFSKKFFLNRSLFLVSKIVSFEVEK